MHHFSPICAKVRPTSGLTGLRLFLAGLGLLLSTLPGEVRALELTLWQPGEFEDFCQNLEPVSPVRLGAALGDYAPLVASAENIETGKIRLATATGLSAMIEKAVDAQWDSLSLFTDAPFANTQDCALLVEDTVLAALAGHYNLHSLWMTTAHSEDSPQQPLRMQFLLLGMGRLIIGYDGSGTVKVKDYEIRSGLYDYAPYTTMSIVNRPDRRGLFAIETRSGPESGVQPFIGPVNSRIASMELFGDNRILVRYRLLFSGEETVERRLIERR